jgi:hypothetical protein
MLFTPVGKDDEEFIVPKVPRTTLKKPGGA